MITEKILEGSTIYLRQIQEDDCGDRYVSWLNDPEVNQYLETKWSLQNKDTVLEFVRDQRQNSHSYLFAIIYRENDVHIGNIKIGPIYKYHKYASLSYFIGEKQFWNRGIATEAIKLACKFGFEDLCLHRIESAAYSCAIGSWKALEKCGFVREAVLRKQVLYNQEYIDVYKYGLLKNELLNDDEKG